MQTEASDASATDASAANATIASDASAANATDASATDADAMAAVDWPKNNSKELIAEFKKHENFKGNITSRVFGNGPQKVWHFEMQPLSD